MTDHDNPMTDGTWELDPDRTTVTVSVKKLGVLDISATLALIEGTVTVSGGQVESVLARVSAESYRSPNAKRNEHIISSDFLDAANHPEIHFDAVSADPVDGSFAVSGTVEVKGKSFPMTFDATNVTARANVASFTATASVDRTSIGVDKMPALVIGRVLDITVDAHANRVDADGEARS